jgi:multidrug efflux pump subunit AcrA (membrane-fusion protein)
MKAWKQVLVSVVVIAIAFVAWAKLYPGADTVLASYGIDWFSTASTEATAPSGAPGQGGAPAARRGGFSREALVVTADAGIGTVNDRLTAIGTGQAVRTVSIRPLVAGQIAEIPVSSGTHVEAGDVILRLDSAEQELDVERARLALGDAERKAARLESLAAQRAVSSVDLDTARSELSEARVALRGAELALQRRTLTAPIAGSLGILSVNVGDYVTTSTDITTIDDRSARY